MSDLLFDWFGFNQISTYISNTTQAKQLIQTKKTGGQPYGDTSSYKVSEFSLDGPSPSLTSLTSSLFKINQKMVCTTLSNVIKVFPSKAQICHTNPCIVDKTRQTAVEQHTQCDRMAKLF